MVIALDFLLSKFPETPARRGNAFQNSRNKKIFQCPLRLEIFG
jgi:hypothetical protein